MKRLRKKEILVEEEVVNSGQGKVKKFVKGLDSDAPNYSYRQGMVESKDGTDGTVSQFSWDTITLP